MAFPVFEVLIETLIFVAVIGIIANSVANPNGNITGGALAIYGLILLLIIVGYIMSLYMTVKKHGGMGGRR